MLSTKGTHQVQIFSQLLALKLTKFLVIFQATSQILQIFKFETASQFFFKLFITLQCHEKLFCTILAETVHDFDKRSPSKCKISDFPLLM